jgi:hypothetical protein
VVVLVVAQLVGNLLAELQEELKLNTTSAKSFASRTFPTP